MKAIQYTITGKSVSAALPQQEQEKAHRLLLKQEAEHTIKQAIKGGRIVIGQLKMFDTGETQKSFFEEEPLFEKAA